MARPTRLDHVAIGLWRIADAPGLAVGELGGRPLGIGPGAGFRWAQWRYAAGGVLEFLEPAGPPGGFLHRFLEQRGPGLHHVTFKVDDLRAAAERAAARGYDVVGYDDADAGWKECFLHPKQAHGVVVQMAESEPGHDEPPVDPAAFPPAPPAAEPPAAVRALRFVMRRREDALRQWAEVLEGRVEERGRELRLRWPESPIALVVELDPAASAEGPRRIDLACPRQLALPAGPHPVLGAAFAQVKDEEPDEAEDVP